MIQVRVEDLGPIAEATVELKPLTIFLGPNGVGKSYMALAIYCLARTLIYERDVSRHVPPILRWDSSLHRQKESLKAAAESAKAAWLSTRLRPGQTVRVQDLPVAFVSLFDAVGIWQANHLSESLGTELERCYGAAIETLSRNGDLMSESRLRIEVDDPDNSFSWGVWDNNSTLKHSHWATDIMEQRLEPRRLALIARDLLDDEFFIGRISRNAFPAPTIPDFGQPHYMPASRSGILLSHKAFSSVMVRLASQSWLRRIDVPKLPGHITDLIEALLSITPSRSPAARIVGAIEHLENEVTGGTVGIEDSTEYPEVYFQNADGKFQLHQVSSMVSETAPIILFLKRLVQPGHLFIIEEPEAHLDADNQRKLASVIAMLVNAGVKVLLTTHSDYFVKQLSNQIVLSQVKPQSRSARAFAKDQVLNPTDVAAYFFRPGSDGSFVEQMEVSPDFGIPVDHFSDVHAAIYDEAVSLEYAPKRP